MSLGTTKIGALDGKASTHVRRNAHLKSMGNTVSAHIYEIKVFRPYPVICIDSYWTTLSIGGKKLVSPGTTKIGVLDGKSPTHVRRNAHLKSMGNTVSAHIYEIKVFRPYPVILYRLRLDHSIHCWKKIGVPRNDQNWCTRW